MKKILFAILLIPLITLAQAGELNIGESRVFYDSSSSTEAGTLYYQSDKLVASEHGGITLVYENDVVVLEAHDTDGDGKLDAFLELNDDEVTSMTGEGAGVFERPEVVEFESLLTEENPTTNEDLVGSVDSIKVPGRGFTFGKLLLIVVIIGGAYWFYTRRKKGDIDES